MAPEMATAFGLQTMGTLANQLSATTLVQFVTEGSHLLKTESSQQLKTEANGGQGASHLTQTHQGTTLNNDSL
jgi:hypothetical protein